MLLSPLPFGMPAYNLLANSCTSSKAHTWTFLPFPPTFIHTLLWISVSWFLNHITNFPKAKTHSRSFLEFPINLVEKLERLSVLSISWWINKSSSQSRYNLFAQRKSSLSKHREAIAAKEVFTLAHCCSPSSGVAILSFIEKRTILSWKGNWIYF